jgi:hypothetical protein
LATRNSGRALKPSQNSLFKAATCVRPVAESRILGLVPVIELIGLGRGFSGRYYVTSTTHSVNTSGYQTNFEVKRNGK